VERFSPLTCLRLSACTFWQAGRVYCRKRAFLDWSLFDAAMLEKRFSQPVIRQRILLFPLEKEKWLCGRGNSFLNDPLNWGCIEQIQMDLA
jgi:hypothetical protein